MVGKAKTGKMRMGISDCNLDKQPVNERDAVESLTITVVEEPHLPEAEPQASTVEVRGSVVLWPKSYSIPAAIGSLSDTWCSRILSPSDEWAIIRPCSIGAPRLPTMRDKSRRRAWGDPAVASAP